MLWVATACAPHTGRSSAGSDLPEVTIYKCGRQAGDVAMEHQSIATTTIPGLDPSAPLQPVAPDDELRAMCSHGKLRYATDLVPEVGWSQGMRCLDDRGQTIAFFRVVVRAGDPDFCRDPSAPR